MKTAVIGVGYMGTKYACLLQDGKIAGARLSAVTRIHQRQKELLAPALAKGLAGLSRDETAVAEMLMRMAAYAKGEGEAPYPLQESIADAAMAILMQEAVRTGMCVHSDQLNHSDF